MSPAWTARRRVYEYINRDTYRQQAREAAEEKAAVEREEEEARRPADDSARLYQLLLLDRGNRSTLYLLLLVTALMLVLPVSAFYLSSTLLFAGWEDKYRLAFSGLVAVVVVNVLSVGFGLYAYWEKEEDETEEEKDTREGKSRAVMDHWVRQVTHGKMAGVGKTSEETKEE